MLEKRTTEAEILEQPDCPAALRSKGYRLMGWFNRGLGSIRVVRRFVQTQAEKLPPGRTLHVLDLGSGHCDIPRAVGAWTRRQGLNVKFTCVEISEEGVRENMGQSPISSHIPTWSRRCRSRQRRPKR